jgi:tetratricopeptide (TPR) repeat protein
MRLIPHKHPQPSSEGQSLDVARAYCEHSPMPGGRWWVIAVLVLHACAAPARESAPPSESKPSASPEPALGDALADRAKKKDLGDFDLTDAALIASGFESRSMLRSARARFESFAAPIVEQLRSVDDPRERAKRLLLALHHKGGLFGEYDARATTLGDILDRRRYNCVSASVVYNVLANRLGLSVSAQLLPTHARTLLELKTKRINVETTSPDGFDPDPELEASILAQVGGTLTDGGRAIVPDKGSIVATLVLIGTIYVNRASIAQEAGDLEGAEHLFARGEAFASTGEMRRILRDQRAALLSQLGADDVLSEDPSRLVRAYRTLKAAVSLDPEQKQIRAAVFQNLRAAAERLIHEAAQKGDEQALLKLASEASSLGMEPQDRSGLRAFALSEVARIRIEKSDFDGAVDAIEHALKEQLGTGDAKLQRALEQNRVSALRLAAITSAKKGDYPRSLALIERIQALSGLSAEQRAETQQDHLRVIHLVGNKRIDGSDFKGAAEVYRQGVRLFPNDATCKNNLVAVLERLALPAVDKGMCSAAEEYLEEIKMIEPSSTFPTTARVKCLMARAEERLKASDFAEAVSLMRVARETNPSEPAVLSNLAVALLRWASSLSHSGSCARAASLAKEIKSLETSAVSPGELKQALGPCN